MAFPLFAPRRGLPAPSNTKSPTVLGPGAAQARHHEVAALLLWTAALFLILALASFEGDPAGVASSGPNWVGPVGEACARVLVAAIGVTAWALPLEAVLLGIPFVRGKKSLVTPARVAGDLLIVLTAAALVQVGWPSRVAFGHYVASGVVGELFGELSRSLFSTVGSFLVGFACLGLILIGRASFSFIALMRLLARFGTRGAEGTAAGAKSLADAWKSARQIEREKNEKARELAAPRIAMPADDEAIVAVLPEEDPLDALAGSITSPSPSDVGEASEVEASEGAEEEAPPSRRRSRRAPAANEEKPKRESKARVEKAKAKTVEAAEEEASAEEEEEEEATDASEGEEPTTDVDDEAAAVAAAVTEPKGRRGSRAATDDAPRKPRAKKGDVGPVIVDTSAALEKEKPTKADKIVPAVKEGFRLPPIDFMVATKVDPTALVDKETLYKNAELLIKTLADYGVSGKVEDILPGPTVTTYEVSPAAGTKVSKVASLADDLALALARKVRILAPIPGKSRIGFELPNERRTPVSLRDLIEDRRFQTMDVPLPVVLGRDIVGNPVYADLASMPHVIVAGATGAGKSVGLNVMLTSLLYRRTPEELRLLMIDPKVVELAPFDRIPHMLLPVVTDMKQAATALKWAVDEMERRYQLFADAGTKNISTFNHWVERVCRGEARNPLPKTVIAKDHNGLQEVLPVRPGEEEGEQQFPEKLPTIVIVVDEFADLMMQQGKDVEASVARLAQKARAAGMHVILATQRPSVDVITGMIKANFPTRIAYRVAQKVDSRTILDEQGAEHLLGRGDMLIKLNGTNETKRVQCPMVSEEEVQLVTDFLRLQGEPVYDENILKPREEDGEGESMEDDAEQDPKYDECVRLVADTRRCSTSWLQRKLGLGYNRAARIVEMMERRGLVGPANGSKDREVLFDAL